MHISFHIYIYTLTKTHTHTHNIEKMFALKLARGPPELGLTEKKL